jgi:Low-density lipoprotein receptor repeat class B
MSMTSTSSEATREQGSQGIQNTGPGRIFFLDLGSGRVLSADPDGSNLKTIVQEGGKHPDGLAIDIAAGHLYWTCMGDPRANDGTWSAPQKLVHLKWESLARLCPGGAHEEATDCRPGGAIAP